VLSGCADYVASEDTVRFQLPFFFFFFFTRGFLLDRPTHINSKPSQDVLIYGAPLLRNITNRDKPCWLISGSEVGSALSLDPPALIDFALLLGTDFAPRIRNIGPHRALQYIHKYGTIESI